MAKYIIAKPDYSIVDPNSADYSKNLHACMSYILENVDNKKRKDAVLEWTKDMEDMNHKLLEEMPEMYHEVTGKYCYIIGKGGVLRKEDEENVLKSINAQIGVYLRVKSSDVVSTDDVLKDTKKNVIGIQEYLKEKISDVCSEFDEYVDLYVNDPKKFDLSDKDVKSIFIAAQLKAGHYRYVPNFYNKTVAELNEVLTGEDPDLKEGYAHLTKTQTKKILSFYEEIISVSEHLKNTGAVKKTRAPKAVNVAKASSKMQYLKEDTGLKIRSALPLKIFGAKEVWIYNTKTRKIGVYIASDASGLSVKGSSIRGFSDSSVEKTVKTSTKIDLAAFAGFNRTNKKNKFKEITSMEVKLKGRINEHCLILAADK